ncbi:hypothetical protein I2W78_32915 [Streptomyces spinoverrucosus]|uniref:hypothetical protein n=1 Tax=Streptomyces spinoverrucosus TaxID=284043 RepID=UPI0018C3F0A8|nr:hypothetical protein [Streptomyces spinoverrucosus]MBG0856532.1 hypothetical protein [Streptomyces spinoverrucosus]
MSDSTSGSGATDFLDRLIARHAPAATAERPGVARVRPRLPGPFERVEAVRARARDTDEDTGPLWPTSTPSTAPRRDVPRPGPAAEAARPHPERERTVVHTERLVGEPAPQAHRPAVAELPLLRPVAAPVTGPRPVPDTGRRASGRPEPAAHPTAASAPIPPGADAAIPAPPGAARPRAADTAAARDAVRQAAARRSGRAPEKVVQVQIGRLEVTAAGPSDGNRQHTPATRRPGATVSLAEYLARGRE